MKSSHCNDFLYVKLANMQNFKPEKMGHFTISDARYAPSQLRYLSLFLQAFPLHSGPPPRHRSWPPPPPTRYTANVYSTQALELSVSDEAKVYPFFFFELRPPLASDFQNLQSGIISNAIIPYAKRASSWELTGSRSPYFAVT